MNKLFDNEDELEFPDNSEQNTMSQQLGDDDDEELVQEMTFKRDKIFNNDFNTGNLDFEEYNLPRVDDFYAEQNLSECYDSHEYIRKKNLEELVDTYFKESEYYETLSTKKKIPKQIIPLVFVAIRSEFEGSEFTGSEIFSSIAEYFGLNYEILYENIPSIYREQLVRELDDKYGVLQKRGVKRLF